MFYKIGVLTSFAKFTGKNLCCATFLKRDSNTDVFLWIFEFFKEIFFAEHLGTIASDFRRVSFLRISLCFFGQIVLANTTNSHNSIIICLKELRFYFAAMCVELWSIPFFRPARVLFSCSFASSFQETKTSMI